MTDLLKRLLDSANDCAAEDRLNLSKQYQVEMHAIAEIEQLRGALGLAVKYLNEIEEFCADPKRPCGEYGAECPISMGEWFSRQDRAELVSIRQVLSGDAPAQAPTLGGQIAAIYGTLDLEDCSLIDREWARQRGYILPTGGTSQLTVSVPE